MGLFDLFRSRQGSAQTSKDGENVDLSLDAFIKALSSKASQQNLLPRVGPGGRLGHLVRLGLQVG